MSTQLFASDSRIDDAPPSVPRRHDLDALRAIAMLLGIGLHAAIPYIPGGGTWAVHDPQTNGLFGVMLAAIHGFRMPLFFLISGFFTMMLYRKRGLKALLSHRFRRIFLPLILGMFTIIPVTWGVSAYAQSRQKAAARTREPQPATIWKAAAMGDQKRVGEWLSIGSEVDARDPYGSTPLMLATLFGEDETAGWLIEQGADVNAVNLQDNSVADMLAVDAPTTQFVAGLIEIEIETRQVEAGRRKIASRLSAEGVPIEKSRSDASATSLSLRWFLTLGQFPLLGHLWFLSFLCWFVVAFVLLVLAGRCLPERWTSDGDIQRWLTLSPLRYAWTIPLTMLPTAFMGQGDFAFGPDTSTGILPSPPVLGYYAIFFAFGAMYFDADDRDGRVGKWWPLLLTACILQLFPLGLVTGSQSSGTGRLISIFAQAAYAWMMTCGAMGCFRRLLTRESAVMRYLSDASYWMYLSHLPLLILFQTWIRDVNVSSFLKFGFVCIVSSIVLLLSYHWFVRYSPIGTFLNGKRERPAEDPSTVVPAKLDPSATS